MFKKIAWLLRKGLCGVKERERVYYCELVSAVKCGFVVLMRAKGGTRRSIRWVRRNVLGLSN